jgi:hypothetical protein
MVGCRLTSRFGGWADFSSLASAATEDRPTRRQGEIWPPKRQILLRKLIGMVEAAYLILTADFADFGDPGKYP